MKPLQIFLGFLLGLMCAYAALSGVTNEYKYKYNQVCSNLRFLKYELIERVCK